MQLTDKMHGHLRNLYDKKHHILYIGLSIPLL